MYSKKGREDMEREREEYIARVKAEKKHIAYMKTCREKADEAVVTRAQNERERENKIKELYATYLGNYQTQLDAAR